LEGLVIKKYIHNNVVIRVHGRACHATVKEATIKFLKKVELCKAKQKELK
jgi:hypothetical protein